MTFYRKYRPQTIEELDNEVIRKRLTSVLSSNQLPHALLFTGPKGIGKTSGARIIAKAINCRENLSNQKNKSIKPCNKCDICLSITNGTSLDILEIDAASNRGIDDIRSLREKIKLTPSLCQYKVYIIDEAHMLTNEAFNALLKTLEEPPIHAVFILCTTESGKLPPTIISRCLVFDFKRASLSELIRSLKRIVKGEKLDIEETTLTIIAKNSDGSFREAAKILEQLSYNKTKITEGSVNEFIGQILVNRADKLLKFLVVKDLKMAFLWLNEAIKNNAEIKVINLDLLEILRSYLLKKTVGLENEEINYDESYEKLTQEEIMSLIALFNQAYLDLKTASIPQLPMELAIIKWASSQKSEEISLTKDQENKEFISEKKIVFNPETPKPRNPGNDNKSVKIELKKAEIQFEKIVALWPQILEAIKPLNHSVHAVLKSARPLALEEGVLVLEAFYKFHKDRLQEPKINTLLASVVCDKLGCQIGIKCVLGEKKNPVIPKAWKPEEVDNDNSNELVKEAEEIFKK